MDPSERLFDGAHLRVTQRGAGPAWVMFDNFDAARSGFGGLNRARTASELGWSVLQVQTAANDWYLNPDLDPALAALPRTGGRALGISMGAFGALLFAETLGLEDAILVSPRFPDALGWPRRAQVYAEDPPKGWEKRLKRATRRLAGGVVLYDPWHRDDRSAVRWLCALNPRLRVLALPFSGHPSTAFFREAEAWGPLQRLFLTLSMAELPTSLARLRRGLRGQVATYAQGLNAARRSGPRRRPAS